jgi:hypothetical protein
VFVFFFFVFCSLINNIWFDILVEARNNFVKIRGLNDDINKAFKSLAELAKVLDEIKYVLEISIFKQLHKLSSGKRVVFIKKVIIIY